jgi:hypothetical protein
MLAMSEGPVSAQKSQSSGFGHRERSRLGTEADPDRSEPADSSQPRAENVIVLSEEFWSEIQEHPIPVDLAAVKALADSPGNLDLYVWLVWRCWTAKSPVSVPLFGPEGLVSQLGISENLRERDFRRQILQWLKVVQQLWSDCPVMLAETGSCLLIKSIKGSNRASTSAFHSSTTSNAE